MVNIDRDRAQSLGVTPQQIQDALMSAYGDRQVSLIYQPANEYQVILEVQPQYQRTPDALRKLYIHSSHGTAGPAGFGGEHEAHGGSAEHQPLRPAAGGDGFVQSEARLLTGSAADR